MLRAIWGCLLAAALPAAHGQPPAAPDALAAAMAAADAAAVARDYRTSLDSLAQAAAVADPDLAPLIGRRRALYERFLAMDALLALAEENEGRLVGIGATRGGKCLAGLVQLFELGVTPGAAIGNRLPDRGRLLVRRPDGSTLTLPGEQIARVQVEWLPPDRDAQRLTWTIGSLRVMLQSGEEVVGSPTWVMSLGSMSFRPAGAEDDTDLVALPPIDRGFDPGNLAAELLILGAPASAGSGGRIGDTEEAAAAAPGGPAYTPPAETDDSTSAPRVEGEPEPASGEDRCPPTGGARPPVEETEHE